MRVLVTGGLGFAGIHLARHFAEKGAEVVVADILEPDAQGLSFLEPVAEKVRIRFLEVRRRDAFEKLVRDEAIGQIIHAAAITPDFETEQGRLDTVLDVNLVGALNAIIVAAHVPEVERLILLSSSGLYGAPSDVPASLQHENGALELDNLYAITKYSAELVAQRCGALSGKRMISVRLASIYGEMERPTGSREHMSHIKRLQDALRSGRRVRVAGKTIERDWMYAEDMAEAVWGLLNAPGWRYPLYNIGTEQAMSFQEIVEIFAQFGLDYVWVDDPQQAEIAMRPDQARAPLDISRLKADTHLAFPYPPADRLEQYLSKSAGAT